MMKTVTWSGGAVNACFCVGRQEGEPYCPCEMRRRGIFQRDGRWVEPARGETDLGPAYTPAQMFTGNEGVDP